MKPTFKTSAVAILVALGVSGCKLIDHSDSDAQVRVPANTQAQNNQAQTNQSSQVEQEAQQKAEQAKKAEADRVKAEQEAKQKAEEQKRLEAEQKAKEAEAQQAKTEAEKARLEREAQEKAEQAKKVEADRVKAEQEAQQKAEEQARLEAEQKAKELEAQQAKTEAEKARLEREAQEKADAAKKAEADRIKAEQEVKLKAEEQKRLEAEQKAKEAEAKKAQEQAEKARLEREAQEKAEQAKKAEAERIKAEQEAKLKAEEQKRLEAERLAKENAAKEAAAKQARIDAEMAKIPTLEGKVLSAEVDIRGSGSHYLDEKGYIKGYGSSLVKQDKISLPKPYERNHFDSESPFGSTQTSVKFNVTEQTQKDIENGGKYLGKHEGVWEDKALESFVVTVDAPVKVNTRNGTGGGLGSLVGSKVDIESKQLNYIYFNNPYSSYGVLFTNKHDQKFFTMGLNSDNYGQLYQNVNGTNKRNYVDSLKGDVTYKGDVVATVTRGVNHSDYLATIQDLPKVDGKIVLNAHFGSRQEQNSVRGYIDSQSIGRVELMEGRTSDNNFSRQIHSFRGELQQLDNNNENMIAYGSSYNGTFVGKEASDVIGNVHLDYTNKYTRAPNRGYKDNVIVSYDAVFGATKQPR